MREAPSRATRPDLRPRDAEATREALLRAATDVFADVGFDGPRVDWEKYDAVPPTVPPTAPVAANDTRSAA